MSEDILEQAYWKFDAMRKGYGAYKDTPKSERDAFKSACAVAIEAENAQLKAELAMAQAREQRVRKALHLLISTLCKRVRH